MSYVTILGMDTLFFYLIIKPLSKSTLYVCIGYWLNNGGMWTVMLWSQIKLNPCNTLLRSRRKTLVGERLAVENALVFPRALYKNVYLTTHNARLNIIFKTHQHQI